jgi:soluble P-type ATPase
VSATARRDLDPAAFEPAADLLPLVTGLELLALVGMVDPPRPTARASIATAKKAGIRVRMITGDYAVTAAAVAGQLGIDGTVLTGAEFGAMSDEEALVKVDGVGVIARVSPEHKVRLVDVLKRQGQIVAMTGDGVNDAPAVKKADIGIAMGTGTEVTQEAAVMILTDDNFSTIVKAVELGRGPPAPAAQPADPDPRAQHLPHRDEDRHARRPAVADLHRRSPVGRGGRRDPQSGPAADRRAAGDAGQPVTSSSSRMSTTPRAINAAPTTASCSAQVRT